MGSQIASIRVSVQAARGRLRPSFTTSSRRAQAVGRPAARSPTSSSNADLPSLSPSQISLAVGCETFRMEFGSEFTLFLLDLSGLESQTLTFPSFSSPPDRGHNQPVLALATSGTTKAGRVYITVSFFYHRQRSRKTFEASILTRLFPFLPLSPKTTSTLPSFPRSSLRDTLLGSSTATVRSVPSFVFSYLSKAPKLTSSLRRFVRRLLRRGYHLDSRVWKAGLGSSVPP